MWIDRLTSSRTTDAIELSARFAEQRQHVLAENLANIDTPDYHTRRLDAEAFQGSLREAMDRARKTRSRRLQLRDNRQFSHNQRGQIETRPVTEPAQNALLHDGTNVQLERLLTDVADNSLSYNLSTSLLRGRFQGLLRAIRGRSPMIRALDISASALVAQRTRLDVISGNIANAETTRQADGTRVPYRRRFASFMVGDGNGGAGVHVNDIQQDPAPFREKYEPGHEDADARGYVQYPNVNITMEYVDAMLAGRAYEANAAMLNVTRGMVQQAIRLFA